MSTTTDGSRLSKASRSRPRRRLFLLAVGLLFIVLACWCGLLARDALVLKGHFDQFEADLIAAGEGAFDLAALRADVAALHNDVVGLQSTGRPLLALAPHLGWLPSIGPDVQAAPELIEAAIELLDVGQIVLGALEPLWPPRNIEGQSALANMLQDLQDTLPQIERAREPLRRALAHLASVNVENLSPGLKGQLERLTSLLPLAEAGFDLFDLTPALIGFDRPKTYIVLLQNDDELRPTGGFISAVARITLERGVIVDMDVRDSYRVDTFLKKPYGSPPEPLLEFMGSEMWLFRDANWSPDFPTSARKAAELYTYGLDVAVDGVVGVNQLFVRNVVEAIGPIEVESGEVVDGSNLLQYMRASWAPPPDVEDVRTWFATRKDFIGVLMNSILARVQTSPGDINWLSVGRALLSSLESGDLMLWSNDIAVSESLAKHGWDGALRSTASDYLMIVDANLGFNKVNTLIESSATYSVTLNHDGTLDAEIVIDYQHSGVRAEGCVHQIAYTLDLSYETLIQDCYWNYVRVFVPSAAQLVSATEHPAPAEYFVTGMASDGLMRATQELDKTVFATLIVVQRGESMRVGLRYELPDSIITLDGDLLKYSLLLQKQPGAPDLPMRITVSWPDEFELASTQPLADRVDAQSTAFDLLLDVDRWVHVSLIATD